MKKLKSQHHVSEERIEANRANARKSTGPKSVEGKLISKQNATKHGLLAKEILLASETSEESRAEYKQLLEDLQQSFEPARVISWSTNGDSLFA